MGGVLEGGAELVGTLSQSNAALEANRTQYAREQAQADAAIQGAIDKGNYTQAKVRILNTRVQREQLSGFANAGVDARSGTAANTQANTAALGEMDAQQAAIDAAREVFGIKTGRAQSKEEYEARKKNIQRNRDFGYLGSEAKIASSAINFGAAGAGGMGKK